LAREAAKQGHAVRVVGGYHKHPLSADSVQISVLPESFTTRVNAWALPWRRPVREAVDWCDAIIVRDYWLAFWTSSAARAAGKPIRIWDFHGYASRELRSRGTRLVSRLVKYVETACVNRCSHIMAVSEGTLTQAREAAPDKCFLLTNGIDCEAFDSVPNVSLNWLPTRMVAGKFVVGIIARFGPQLEPDVVLASARLLGSDFLFVFLGDGPSLQAARTVRMPENVVCPGEVPRTDVIGFLVGVCHACVAPYRADWPQSRIEGHFASRKVKEYAAAGNAIVVSDVSGYDTFLCPERNCVTYQPGNAADLATKLRSLRSQPVRRGELGKAACQDVRQFRWNVLYEKSPLAKILSTA